MKALMATKPSPPGRFSTTTGFPQRAASRSAKSRPPISDPEPGPSGRMNLTVRCGQACAGACPAVCAATVIGKAAIAPAAATSRMMRWRFIWLPLCGAAVQPGGLSSFRRPIEIFQIRSRLVLLGGHQPAIHAQEIVLVVDLHVMVIGATNVLDPNGALRAIEAPGHRPGVRQGMIDRGDLVAQEARIGVVEMDELPDDGLIVVVERKAAAVERARTLEAAGLDR